MEQKVFSEVLNDLITICDEIDSNIARKAGLNKSYLCKMKKGLMLPPDCSVLEKLMEAMNLNDEDSGKLYRAYMRGKLSDELKRTEKAVLLQEKKMSAELLCILCTVQIRQN